jgi:hypothetical protein
LVIWVTQITKFGNSGHPKKETEFGNNRRALPKNGISLEGIMIFLDKMSAKTPVNFCEVSLMFASTNTCSPNP